MPALAQLEGNGDRRSRSIAASRPLDSATLHSLRMLHARRVLSAEKLYTERLEWIADRHGEMFGGARNLYSALGWPSKLTYNDYVREYRRGGIAGAIVDIFPEDTWAVVPDIRDLGDPKRLSPWEESVIELCERLNVWSVFEEADTLACLGPYAGIFIVAPGLVNSELTTGPITALRPIPYDRMVNIDRVKINNNADADNSRVGLPETYHVAFDPTNNRTTRPVHHSRIIHIANNTLGDSVVGTPALERVYNDLLDLHKNKGGGAEAAWVNAMMRVLFDAAPDSEGQLGYLESGEEDDQADELEEMWHGERPYATTVGVTPKVIRAQVSNFSANGLFQLKCIAASIGVPFNRFMGSELGLRSSEKDKERYDDKIDRRRNREKTPQIKSFIDTAIATGEVDTPVGGMYVVSWPKRDEQTESEKANTAKTKAETNKLQKEVGDKPVFRSFEIRRDDFGIDEPIDEMGLDDSGDDSGLQGVHAATSVEVQLGAELVDDHVDSISTVITDAWRDVTVSDIENKLGDLDSLESLVDSTFATLYAELLESMSEVFDDAGERHASIVTTRGTWAGTTHAVASLQLSVSPVFTPDTTEAVSWLENNVDDFLNAPHPDSGISIAASTYQGLREAAVDGLSRNLGHAQIAREIRPFVGLNLSRIEAITNLTERLESARPGTLVTYGKTRVRIPKTGVTQALIDKHRKRYTDILINQRSRTLARDLINRANIGAQNELWRQGVEDGTLDKTALGKMFLKNTDRHAEFDGEIVGIDEPFTYEPGSSANCGCGQTLVRI